MKYWLLLSLCIASLHAEPVDDLKKSVSDTIPRLHGWCSQEKALQFIDLVLEVRPEVCVEIGVFGGRSLFPVASALKFLEHGIVIGIDPWSKEEILAFFDPAKDMDHIAWWSKINLESVYYSCLSMLSEHQLEDYCITLRTTSELASYVIGEIDILYIDGNHHEKISSKDVELSLPKVRPGGYIWLNDCLWSDLQPAVDLLFEACDFVKLIESGNCVLFRKR